MRNPRYWGRRAYLDRLVLRFRVEGTEPVEWFRRGELDIAWAFPAAPPALAALRQERGLRLVTPPSPSWEHFAIRIGPGGHPALKNKLVRRALAYGIDRTALVRQLFSYVPNHPSHDSVVIVRPSPHYRRTGADTGTARPRPDGCSSRPAAAAVSTASTSAPDSGSRFAS